ncbi:MAG: hypothetical protein ACREJC_02140 [Tepidisphaeraceae bacterium]
MTTRFARGWWFYCWILLTTVLLIAAAGLTGCSGRPQLLPNSDKSLQRSSAEFAADAAKRFPYKLQAPRGGEALARAEVAYWSDTIEISNLSDEDWTDVELWINQEYVVFLPTMPNHQLRHMTFQMIFNDKGHYLPTKNLFIKKMEIYRDGKMYDVKMQLAD